MSRPERRPMKAHCQMPPGHDPDCPWPHCEPVTVPDQPDLVTGNPRQTSWGLLSALDMRLHAVNLAVAWRQGTFRAREQRGRGVYDLLTDAAHIAAWITDGTMPPEPAEKGNRVTEIDQHPTTEDLATKAAARFRPEPVQRWELPALAAKPPEHHREAYDGSADEPDPDYGRDLDDDDDDDDDPADEPDPGPVRTPAWWEDQDWCTRVVMDPDGWRQDSPDGPLPWDTPITRAEYERRAAASTTMPKADL